jgi:hypothetical protein
LNGNYAELTRALRQGDSGSPHLQHVVRRWVERDWVSFTFVAQVVIGADHALITGPDYLLLAAVATGGVLLAAVLLDDKGLRVGDLDEVVWVLLRRDCKTLPARIIVRTVQAFISIPINLGVAHVTDGVVQYWLRLGLWNWGSGRGGLTGLPLAFTGKNGVNDDTTGLLDFEEFMGSRMATPPAGDAKSAHVVVRAVQALVSNSADGRVANVANNSRVNWQFHRSYGIHFMINNDSGRRGARRSRGRALLLVTWTEGLDHGLLEVIHEINRGALNISLCLGNIATVGRWRSLSGLGGLVRINVHGDLGENNGRGRNWD